MSVTLNGGCLCGDIRYHAGPILYPPTLCHCESCRRASGAHALGWFTVRSSDLTFVAGVPRLFESSPGVRRTFCGQCGTPLTYTCDARSGELDVTIGSLDEPSAVVPADHVWMEDAPAWDLAADGRPAYPRSRIP